MWRRGQRGSDEAVALRERYELFDRFAVGQRLELHVEPTRDLDERIATVLVALRHDAIGRRSPLDGDVPSPGVEVEARERAAGERREEEVLGGPVGLGVRGLSEPRGDRVFQPPGSYPGQRVITTFFSV
jgi:hypothetical protein